jgi:glutathione synthase/RimK-type ligase-like ATP-grasp enzyme
MAEQLKIGIMVGMEWSWPPAFIQEIENRNQGVTAEFVKLGGTLMDELSPYRVIVDRISHEVPYYRCYLKNAVLQGTVVINDPFMWTADDKFFEAGLATRLGVASPKTIALPNKDYMQGIDREKSLRNLSYPLDWKAIVDYIGLPMVLKDAHGGGWKEVYIVHSLDELVYRYDQSGRLTMIVQEFIEWDQYIRCVCLGSEEILPIKYNPKEKKYYVEHDHMTQELGERVVNDARKLCQALGYDMNTVEFAVRQGVPYAIDFMNPAPDFDVNSLTQHYFDWVVKGMADLTIRLAKSKQATGDRYAWYKMAHK